MHAQEQEKEKEKVQEIPTLPTSPGAMETGLTEEQIQRLVGQGHWEAGVTKIRSVSDRKRVVLSSNASAVDSRPPSYHERLS